MYQVQPKKRLGQHFLNDKNIAQKITDSLLLIVPDVLEIGPGTGVLTDYLLKKEDFRLIAVDADRESVEFLHRKYPEHREKIILGDFLRLNTDIYFPEKFSVIGNLPYNISSQIFFKIIENRNNIPQVVCMIQKEVAERIASPAGSKRYGILSVFLQTYYNIEYLFTVHENVFSPPPKVKSGVIRLIRNSRKSVECDENLFFRVVKTAFNQRRKTLRNALRQLLPPDFDSPYMNMRAERLDTDDFIRLTSDIEKYAL